MQKSILFITHEATRTGAPFVLLYFLQWLKEHQSNISLSVLALKDGELEEEFKVISENYYSLDSVKKSTSATLQNKILKKLGKFKTTKQKQDIYLRTIAKENFDVIFSNTILSIPFGYKIKLYNKNSKHLVHVHELGTIIKLNLPKLNSYSLEVDHFIAASNLVKENLISNWDIPKLNVTRVYECSKVDSKIGIKMQSDFFRIGGSGTVHWRKGSDLFIQVATYLKNNYPEEKIKFTWVGSISKSEKIIIEEDLRKAGVNNMVDFVGQQDDPISFYNEFDVFLMTSREDPFPLVCIEVGILGKPIICFKGATGSEEVIEKGGGVVVPYLDIKAMASEIINYKNNPNLIETHGAINKVEFSKFTPKLICPQIFSVIKNNI